MVLWSVGFWYCLAGWGGYDILNQHLHAGKSRVEPDQTLFNKALIILCVVYFQFFIIYLIALWCN